MNGLRTEENRRESAGTGPASLTPDHPRRRVPVSYPDSAPPSERGIGVKLAASRELYAYWNLLRGQRSAPERSEIDPSAMRGVLADTFILEVDLANRYPLRIAGTRTNALFLRELKGAAFLDLWRPADQPEIAALLAGLTNEATAVLAGASAGPQGMRPLELELLLLPLRHRGNTHSRILGACTPTCLPSWIGLLPAMPMNLLTLRMLGRTEAAFPEKASAESDDPSGPVDFGKAPDPDRRGHLFIFTSTAHRR